MILGSFGHLFTVRLHFYRVELPVSFLNHNVKAILVFLILLGYRVGSPVSQTFVPVKLLLLCPELLMVIHVLCSCSLIECLSFISSILFKTT
jgi:hypothetical protein